LACAKSPPFAIHAAAQNRCGKRKKGRASGVLTPASRMCRVAAAFTRRRSRPAPHRMPRTWSCPARGAAPRTPRDICSKMMLMKIGSAHGTAWEGDDRLR
jgi:hypothetical protein